MQVFVWWLLELHIIKIVSSYIIWVTVKEASKHLLSKLLPMVEAGQHLLCSGTPKCREMPSSCQTSLKLWDPASLVSCCGPALTSSSTLILYLPRYSQPSPFLQMLRLY